MRSSVVLAIVALALTVGPAVHASGSAIRLAISCNMHLSNPGSYVVHNSVTGCASGLTIANTAGPIRLDCADHTIGGGGTGTGILLLGAANVRISNCHVHGFHNNFVLRSSTRVVLRDNTAFAASSNANFYLDSTSRSTLVGNIAMFAQRNARGFLLERSSGNSLTDNVSTGNAFRGFDVESSSNANTFVDNISFRNTSAGFVIANSSRSNSFSDNTSVNNEAEGFIALGGATQNVFTRNGASANGSFDCADTNGPNANAWAGRGNVGDRSSPAGLCSP